MGDGNRRTKEGAEVLRAEIDTSAPFESVREAASRFGGIGFWKPSHGKLPESSPESTEPVDIQKLREQTAQLENDLILKETETLGVLKELESIKLVIDELKKKLHKETSENNMKIESDKEADKENHFTNPNASAPSRILMELKQAKLNITKTTTGLAHIRASVASLNTRLEKERALLEKTHQRLSQNSSKISSLEDDLTQTSQRLQLAKDGPHDFARELHQLSSEMEQFKKVGEAARLEVQRAVSEIEETRARMKVAETRLVAAVKMKLAARATEAMALQEIKALSDNSMKSEEEVTLTYEEYASLISKTEEAEKLSNKRVVDAMLRVDEANMSKAEILKRVEEATEEVKTTKRVLEEAVERVEAANRGKLEAEGWLRKWRSDNVRRRRRRGSSSTKFKSSSLVSQSQQRRRDVCLVDDRPTPCLKQTLSIGQILSQKLLLAEEFEPGKLAAKYSVKRKKVSLGEMLSKPNEDSPDHQNLFSAKRKKFGFGRFSLLLAKQKKRKKMMLCDLR